MKVLVATGIEKLDEHLLRLMPENDIEAYGQCFHRSVLHKVINESGIDTLVISPALSGENDLIALIRSVREKGIRVIVLPGSPFLPQTLELVKALVPYGIYDFVYDKVSPKDVIDRLKNPGNLGDVAKSFAEMSIDLQGMNSDNLNSEHNKKPAQIVEEDNVSTEDVDNDIYSVQNDTGDGTDIRQNNNKNKQSAIAKQVGNITGMLSSLKKISDNKKLPVIEEVPVPIQNGNTKSNGKPVSRKRTGTITLSLAINSEDLHKWFTTTFSRLVNIKIIESISHDEIKQHIYDNKPDILILMRNGPMGGIPESEQLAEWSVKEVPAVLYIAGELDDEGKRIVKQVESSGVRHILTCQEGGFISGEELVFHVHNIVKELNETDINAQNNDKDTDQDKKDVIDNLSVFKKGVSRLGGILKTSSQEEDNNDQLKIKHKKKHKGKANLREGISLDDSNVDKEDDAVEISHSNAIIPGGLFAVVSPWRPGLAGRLCAQAVKMLADINDSIVAYIGASSLSTGSMWLDISDEELIMSDWRVPGSQAPVEKDNIEIYAVDPVKNLKSNYDEELWALVKSVRKKATYTVIDFADDINSAQKAAFHGWSVLLVIVPGGDPVETKTTIHWLKALQEGKKNVITGIDLRGAPPAIPEGIKPKVTIRNNPADALVMSLKITDKAELHWIK
ncbi:hypothetical protein SAMN05660649_04825 [Desulfotomaculum arcticum]|uniref:Uncharacterized protein n=1 Tax=Desulfotruncus arcticus DSM 17038 TaxID=1121424 RepID=A0A1I2Z9E9_9FIRM|nr:hypothetical protein [Desulfotruncus arcticus]SFH34310.1 hypothetical protein SAMN05660649_04825 [Desulfotomaculum arcticum] [Desulfotruncus arcticus DSM 17038]